MLKILMGPKSKYSWAKALAPGHMGMLGAWAAAARAAAAHAPSMPMCPGAKALAHEYFDFGPISIFSIKDF